MLRFLGRGRQEEKGSSRLRRLAAERGGAKIERHWCGCEAMSNGISMETLQGFPKDGKRFYSFALISFAINTLLYHDL